MSLGVAVAVDGVYRRLLEAGVEPVGGPGQADVVNRIHKTLEDANVKLASVGRSWTPGRRGAVAARMAELVDPRMAAK